jgi:hypothetical protein
VKQGNRAQCIVFGCRRDIALNGLVLQKSGNLGGNGPNADSVAGLAHKSRLALITLPKGLLALVLLKGFLKVGTMIWKASNTTL